MRQGDIKTLLFGQAASLYDQETLQEVTLRVITSEELSVSTSVTGYPVETGTDWRGTVSDHTTHQPDIISLEAVLTDPGSVAITDRTTVEEKLGRLRYWAEDGILLSYSGPCMSTLLKNVYQLAADNLVITQMDAVRSIDNGTAITVSVTLQKVTLVTSEIQEIDLPQPARSVKNKGEGTIDEEEINAEQAGSSSEWTYIGGWY